MMNFDRRGLFKGAAMVTAGLATLVTGAPAASAVHKSGMNHKRWTGKLSVYLANDPTKREFAREIYDVTTQPDGLKTIRQISEWDDVEFLKDEPSCDLGDQLASQTMKDVIMNVAADETTISAYVQFFKAQKFQGSAWYDFAKDGVECIGSSPEEGRFSDKFVYRDVRPFFYFHSILSDISWYLPAILAEKRGQPIPKHATPRLRFMATPTLLGNAGPVLVKPLAGPEGGRPHYGARYIGKETVTVGAGTFETHHCRITHAKTGQTLDYWVAEDDNIPVRSASHGLHWDLEYLADDYDGAALK